MTEIFFCYPSKNEEREREEKISGRCGVCGGKTVRDETTGLHRCDKCRIFLLPN